MSIISFNNDFDRFLQEILSSLVSTIPNAETGSLQILDGEFIYFRATVGFPLEKLKECVFDADSDLYTLLTPEMPNIRNELLKWGENNLSEKQLSILKEFGRLDSIKAIIKISLVVNNQIWGFLNIENHESENAFTEQDVIITKAFKGIAENLIKMKLQNKNLINRYCNLSKSMNRTYNLYDNYNHDLRNIFQLFMLILGLETDEDNIIQKKEFQEKLNIIESVMHDLFKYRPSSDSSHIINAEVIKQRVSILHQEKFVYF